MKHIRTITELVDFFGGDTALASKLDISQSAVAHWKLRNQIAGGWHLRLLSEIKRRGATVAPDVFGLPSDMELDLPKGLARRRASTSARQ